MLALLLAPVRQCNHQRISVSQTRVTSLSSRALPHAGCSLSFAGPAFSPVLPTARLGSTAVRPHCAVVASSGAMIGSQCGPVVDAAPVVFRMNFADASSHKADVGARTTVQLVNSHNGRQLSASADSVNNTIRVNATRAARARLRACADNVSLLFYSDEWVKGGPVPDNDARLVALLNQMNNSKCVVPPPFGKLKAFKLSESLAKRHRSGAIVDVFRIAMEDHSARAVTTSNVHHTDSLVDKPAPKERSKAFKLPSAGFYAVHAALLLCSSVSLFGFQDSPQKTFHYWGNQSALDVSGSRRFHNFEAEHEYYQRRLKDSARVCVAQGS